MLPAGPRTGRDRLEPALPRRNSSPPRKCSTPTSTSSSGGESERKKPKARQSLSHVGQQTSGQRNRPQFCVSGSTDSPPSLGQGKLVLLLPCDHPFRGICPACRLTAARPSDRLHCHARRTATGDSSHDHCYPDPDDATAAITCFSARESYAATVPRSGPAGQMVDAFNGCQVPLDGPLVVRQLDPAPGFDVFAFSRRQPDRRGMPGRADRGDEGDARSCTVTDAT